MDVKKRVAFNRHQYYSKKYPLDSSFFITPELIYKFHNLKVQKDYACMGLILFNLNNHSKIMSDWFYKYDSSTSSITGGGDQSHVNYEIQNWGQVCWLDYRFQALWILEIAWKYPFLYNLVKKKNRIITDCIEASLSTNYFLHFAGSWYESNMWSYKKIYDSLHIF